MKNNKIIHRIGSTVPAITSKDAASRAEFKRLFLKGMGSIRTRTSSLRETVLACLAHGIHWKELIRWADQAGYSDKTSRNVLGEILRAAGIRRRSAGAGKETPQAALAMMASALRQHGDVGVPLLLAAYRAGKKHLAAKALGQVSTALRV